MTQTKSQGVQLVHLAIVRDRTINYPVLPVNDPTYVAKLANQLVGDRPNEHLVVFCLDTKLKPTHVEIVSIGGTDYTLADAASILRLAILSNSTSIILAHNHPSGSLDISQADINSTRRLAEAAKVLSIEILDHIIVNDSGQCTSLAAAGCMT
jgi:DNA repair protein RadC